METDAISTIENAQQAITALRDRVDVLRVERDALRARVQRADAERERDVGELAELLERQRAAHARNVADLQAEVESLRGRLEDFGHG